MRKIAIGTAAAVLVLAPLTAAPASADPAPSCWGLASAAFAQEGMMGEHSSSFAGSKRVGLRNLARAALGPDATMADLGAFVAGAEGYDIAECED